jgi:hypothetical protein
VRVKKYRSPFAAGEYRIQQRMKSLLEEAEQKADQQDENFEGDD